MAGTLTLSTLSDGTNSTSATNPILGSAKAWVNFDGSTATPSTIRASFNVSSVTRNATGDYTVNLTNALPSANGCVVLGQSYANSRGDTALNHNTIAGGYMASTTAIDVQTVINSASAYYNVLTFSVAVFL